MGFYSRVIFPHLCNLALDNADVAEQRAKLLSTVQGEVLEIGFGTGLNLPHYPQGVQRIVAVDPNPGMHRLAQRQLRQSSIKVDHRQLSGELLPFPDSRFDSVASTFTLCSIHDVQPALAEVFRVLRPGGRFFFLEHGLSPEPNIQRWQRSLNWLEKLLADGCHLDRPIKELVASQPFRSLDVEAFYLERLPKTHGYLFRGAATK